MLINKKQNKNKYKINKKTILINKKINETPKENKKGLR